MAYSNNPSGIWSDSYGYHKAIRIIFNIIIVMYIWLAVCDVVQVLTHTMYSNNATVDNLFWMGGGCAGITVLSVIGLAHNKKFALWTYLIGCIATAILTLIAFAEITFDSEPMERLMYALAIIMVISLSPLLYFLGKDILD